ncbi:RNA polymerase sigma-70 factor, ECF subfamily [Polaribacter sp. Hel1_33_78]|uniref:RNA polymerase sigma factor n=1 Tax=unclassified Polaribacter TaxID=196858 RepID=UPI00087DC40E|nr:MULTISPECIES: RNA polymerase sigma factor [unclassified Polaribacter]MBT3740588.1 RNA polymerase sigma factor [Polaribacter sp.]MBT4412610.1 RNA polymerase sigma factor [Polaribacter sp.]MBT7815573.1 RNA polymerase sigma factor [Polaribacter sp.]MDG1194725.1 RNA polymerase sigma factor [Polaribacter sp.]MDG1403093.1 RNA polymerase sigma factor [Polaribacter sp.]
MTKETLLIAELKNVKTKEKAFRELIYLYKKRLYWHIRKIVISHDDADDVLQNTFIKIFRNIDTFNQQSKLYSWIYRIATNESITFINKRAKERKEDISDYQQELVSTLTNDNLFTGDEIQLILQKAIATLPEKQKLVFNMKYFDELKYTEISEILETSVGALKASYFHAVKKIEKYIQTRAN